MTVIQIAAILAGCFCTVMFFHSLWQLINRPSRFHKDLQCLYEVGKRDGQIQALRAMRKNGCEHALELSDPDGMEMITADSKTAHEQTREEFNHTNGIED